MPVRGFFEGLSKELLDVSCRHKGKDHLACGPRSIYEIMGRAFGDMYKIAGLCLVHLVARRYIHLPFEDIERLDLIMVDVKRWATIGWHQRF